MDRVGVTIHYGRHFMLFGYEIPGTLSIHSYFHLYSIQYSHIPRPHSNLL